MSQYGPLDGSHRFVLTPTDSHPGVFGYVTVQALGRFTQIPLAADVSQLTGTHHTASTSVSKDADAIVAVHFPERTVAGPSAFSFSLLRKWQIILFVCFLFVCLFV